jgi:chromosome segregation ATPase
VKKSTLSDVLDAVVGMRGDMTHMSHRLDEHGVALHELRSDVHALRSDVHELRETVHGHSRALERIERRQIAETRSLDDHERRITKLERRSL